MLRFGKSIRHAHLEMQLTAYVEVWIHPGAGSAVLPSWEKDLEWQSREELLRLSLRFPELMDVLDQEGQG